MWKNLRRYAIVLEFVQIIFLTFSWESVLGENPKETLTKQKQLDQDEVVHSDLSQTSHCNIKGLSVSEVMRNENMITQVRFS